MLNRSCFWFRPFLVNELVPQHLLHDRRKVYEVWSLNFHLIFCLAAWCFVRNIAWHSTIFYYDTHTHTHMHIKHFSTHPLENVLQFFVFFLFFSPRVLKASSRPWLVSILLQGMNSLDCMIYFLKSASPHWWSILMTIIEPCHVHCYFLIG
jgi:hypothetical protein